MSLEDCVWQEPLLIVQRHNEEQQHQQLQQCYMYELQDRLARLRIDPILPIVGSNNQGYRNNVFLMTYFEENENDNNYNEHHRHLPAPFPFRYESPPYSRSLSITDTTYSPGNNNTIVTNYDENDYDDMEDKNPRKGLLKQIFCLPLN